ncbi:MAG: transglycosylase domain-containing protein, partial [Actinomycetota bacterium]|nr:transglycosylase domain-containing protein [Actinomycetota bacterium]
MIGILVGLAGLSAIGYLVSIAASAPPLNSLKPRDLGSASEVRAADGTRLGFIQSSELRRPVEGSRIPQTLKDATVAIEDQRYYHHKGVDYTGVVRAALKNLTNRKTVQGGSTITMQLVRNLYITQERTYQRKIREAKLAEELENEHSKQWILDKYLNTVPFGTIGGQTAVGAQAAARMYFGKDVSDLKLHEAALLAGLPQAPSTYSPVRAPEKAEARRNEVLRKMAEIHMITPEAAAQAIARPLDVNPSRYFTGRRESYFFDFVKDELIKQYGAKTVRQGGLRVDTTIELKKQAAARKAINGRLAGIGPSSAIVTIDPRNGYIKAMASSADYGKSKFNLAAQGHRQPGSTFKVMVLMTALRKGVDPRSTTYNSHHLAKGWLKEAPDYEVKTYDGSQGGRMDLVKATLKSDNTVYAQLIADLGPEEVKRTAYDLGIKTHLNGYYAEGLGGLRLGVSPLEMANAYATIADGGFRNRPTAITKITFPDGHSELPRRFKVKRTKAFEDGVTHEATKILEANIKGGTGTRAQIDCPAAGKTGTTDEHSDGWFVGFTPRLSSAVWVGYPSAQVHMKTEYHGGPVAGGTFPAEIWGDYMKAAKGSFCGGFKPPVVPARFSPFFGQHSRTGGDEKGGGTLAPGTAAPSPKEKRKRDGGGKKDKGAGNFDPDLYE